MVLAIAEQQALQVDLQLKELRLLFVGGFLGVTRDRFRFVLLENEQNHLAARPVGHEPLDVFEFGGELELLGAERADLFIERREARLS
ncbi:MAG: hypothetical protein KDA83_21785, partial [Planctomycetales bacterium]|nr:hypothetical protein [Planctomycetales bacterium]